MKNTTAYSYKIAIVATSLVMAYFASGIASIAQASELLKAEPIKNESLIDQAQVNLAISFSTISVASGSVQDSAKSLIAMNNDISVTNKEITLSKEILRSE
jgi:hypothetical protein